MKRKCFGAAAAIVLSLILLAGCANGGAPAAPAPAADVAQDVPSEDRELRKTMMLGVDVTTLDPFIASGGTSFLLVNSLFCTPWVLDLDFNVHFRMATGFEISDCGLIYTITLREGVTFHDGTRFTAEDFAYSAQMAQTSPVFSVWANFFDVIEVIDEYTVEITLTQPYSAMVHMLQNLLIVPKAAHIAADGDFGYEPVGSGPYMLARHDVGSRVLLRAFDDYHAGVPAIRYVSYTLIPERSTVAIALETGEIDFSADFPRTDIDRLEALDHLQLLSKPSLVFTYVLFNNNVEPWDNPLVRAAVAHAIDRQAIIQVAVEGHGVEGHLIVNEMVFGYSEIEGWPFNPERAAELLAEAGFPGGEGFPPTTLYTFAFSPLDRIIQIIQLNLRDIGLDFPIEVTDVGLFFDLLNQHVVGIGISNMGLGTDASEYAAMLVTSGGLNASFFSNPEMDMLFDRAVEVSDPQERLEVYRQIWALYQEEVPYAVLYFDMATIMASADLDLSKAYIFGLYGSTNILPFYLSWR